MLHWLRRRVSPGQAVLLAWAVPYFATTGAFLAKFPRYLAPLVALPRRVRGRGRAGCLPPAVRPLGARRGQIAWALALAAVGLFSVGWALAFTGIYSQEHPWLQASQWIYAHVPAGSQLLTEAWDDALPLALDEVRGGPPPREYQRVELPLYDADTPAKADTLAEELQPRRLRRHGQQPPVAPDRTPDGALSDEQPVLSPAAGRRVGLYTGGGIRRLSRASAA